jgi:hypothetical protein
MVWRESRFQIGARAWRIPIGISVPLLVMNKSVVGQVTFYIYQDDAPYTTVGLLNNNVMIFVV